MLFHILDNGTLGKGQFILSLGLVVKEGFNCTLQRKDNGIVWSKAEGHSPALDPVQHMYIHVPGLTLVGSITVGK